MARLIKLDCHSAEECAKRYERALKLQHQTQIISSAALSNQRWVLFVDNGYSSAVVLSHGLQSGMCSCEDFKKHQKTCKHIYAAVLAINEAKQNMRKTYEERHFKKIPSKIETNIIQNTTLSFHQEDLLLEESLEKHFENKISELTEKKEPFVIA